MLQTETNAHDGGDADPDYDETTVRPVHLIVLTRIRGRPPAPSRVGPSDTSMCQWPYPLGVRCGNLAVAR
jgi:hypothetical protein